METVIKIRRLCLVEGKSISEVARRFQLSRTTVRKYLKDPDPPTYNQAKSRPKPQMAAFEALLHLNWIPGNSGYFPARFC
jgi:transposase